MNLEDIMLTESTRHKKPIYYDSAYLYEIYSIGKSIEMESRSVGCLEQEKLGEMGNDCKKGQDIFGGGDKNILKMTVAVTGHTQNQ